MPVLLSRSVVVPGPFSLSQTAAPAAWAGERSPHHCWRGGAYIWVGREHDVPVWRIVRQADATTLTIEGSGSAALDRGWATSVLGADAIRPVFGDPVIAELASRFEGLRPLSDGSLFEGIVTSIIGQSISVAAAAVTQRKLCESFGDSLDLAGRQFWPLPSAAMLANTDPASIRECGVTWKRAEAIHHVAHLEVRRDLPTTEDAMSDPAAVVLHLVSLPGIGRWTAESAVLWGTGAIDAHPTNDVALLRAARRRYDRPDMTLRDLDLLAETWRPGRSIAARLLWTDLLGVAP